MYGTGEFSNINTSGAVTYNRPDQPMPVSTQNSGTNVIVTWDAPNNRGSPITDYRVLFS